MARQVRARRRPWPALHPNSTRRWRIAAQLFASRHGGLGLARSSLLEHCAPGARSDTGPRAAPTVAERERALPSQTLARPSPLLVHGVRRVAQVHVMGDMPRGAGHRRRSPGQPHVGEGE